MIVPVIRGGRRGAGTTCAVDIGGLGTCSGPWSLIKNKISEYFQ
jgi:hypothetical protein